MDVITVEEVEGKFIITYKISLMAHAVKIPSDVNEEEYIKKFKMQRSPTLKR